MRLRLSPQSNRATRLPRPAGTIRFNEAAAFAAEQLGIALPDAGVGGLASMRLRLSPQSNTRNRIKHGRSRMRFNEAAAFAAEQQPTGDAQLRAVE